MNNSGRLVSSLLRASSGQNTVAVRKMSGLPGKRQLEQAKNWIPSLAVYGATAGAALVYFTDWRVITDYIPYYNGKYTTDE